MPTSNTITAWYSFTALTVIKSAEVNSMFNLIRGHWLPIDGSTTAMSNRSYNLGSTEYRWKNVYGNVAPDVVSTTGSMSITSAHDVVLMNSTAATITANLPTAVGFYGTLVIKNAGTGGNTVYVDGNGAQTIDATATINLVDLESICLVSDQSNWWSI